MAKVPWKGLGWWSATSYLFFPALLFYAFGFSTFSSFKSSFESHPPEMAGTDKNYLRDKLGKMVLWMEICILGITITSASMLVERTAAAIWVQTYERKDIRLGLAFVSVTIRAMMSSANSNPPGQCANLQQFNEEEQGTPHDLRFNYSRTILSSISIIEYLLIHEDPNELLTFCLSYSSSDSVGENLYNLFSILLATNIFIFTAFGLLYWHCWKSTKGWVFILKWESLLSLIKKTNFLKFITALVNCLYY
uniref:Uncharacterized protein n=1 Tax=Heterorhabditis bacteriophora TaxID=37862 RepID=A0A1I7X4N2_HETBA